MKRFVFVVVTLMMLLIHLVFFSACMNKELLKGYPPKLIKENPVTSADDEYREKMATALNDLSFSNNTVINLLTELIAADKKSPIPGEVHVAMQVMVSKIITIQEIVPTPYYRAAHNLFVRDGLRYLGAVEHLTYALLDSQEYNNIAHHMKILDNFGKYTEAMIDFHNKTGI